MLLYSHLMRRASIVYNPAARNAPSKRRLLAAAAAMAPRGWDVDVLASEAPLHSRTLAREAALAGSSVVFACGGDGTVNEVVNGLVGSPAALGILRAGTGNVFGKEVHVHPRLERALEVLEDGQEYRFDLGFAEGESVSGAEAGRRYFIGMAGIGFDGAVVHNVPRLPKRILGTTSYVLWGAAEAMRFRRRPAQVVLDGAKFEADLYWMLLANTRSYGGVADVATQAVANDGVLDVYLFSGQGVGWVVRIGASIALKRHQAASGVSFTKARSAAIESPGLQVQADGEYFGETPMAFGIAQEALSVLLYKGAADSLLPSRSGPTPS